MGGRYLLAPTRERNYHSQLNILYQYQCDCRGQSCDEDNCPFIDNPDQEDLDEDGIGDRCDTIPSGTAVVGPVLPPPPFSPFDPLLGGPGLGDVAPSPDITVANGAPGVERAPNPDANIPTRAGGRHVKKVHIDSVDPNIEEIPDDVVEDSNGCSTTGPMDTSTMALFLLALLGLRWRRKPSFMVSTTLEPSH